MPTNVVQPKGKTPLRGSKPWLPHLLSMEDEWMLVTYGNTDFSCGCQKAATTRLTTWHLPPFSMGSFLSFNVRWTIENSIAPHPSMGWQYVNSVEECRAVGKTEVSPPST